MSTTRLAMYINALLATCQDPRNFLGLDLAETLARRMHELEQYQKFVNPLVHLSLCLVNHHFSWQDIQNLHRLLVLRFPDEVSKDIHILATTALSCILKQDPGNHLIKSVLNDTSQTLLSQRNPSTGSFGTTYSTALAAQALISIDSARSWNPKVTFDYLARNQTEDGSFGDMQSTYYTVIALSGRSLLHLRNTRCDSAYDTPVTSSPVDDLYQPGPKKSVFYSLRVGFPETFSASIQLAVPVDTDFYRIMRIAEHIDPRFRFKSKITNDELGVYSIANVPNDAERGLYWNLYKLRKSDTNVDIRQRFTGDIRKLVPDDTDELLYWYLPFV